MAAPCIVTQIALDAIEYLIADRLQNLAHRLETGMECASAHVGETSIEAIAHDRFEVPARRPLCGELPLLVCELYTPQRRMSSLENFIGKGIDWILGVECASGLFRLAVD